MQFPGDTMDLHPYQRHWLSLEMPKINTGPIYARQVLDMTRKVVLSSSSERTLTPDQEATPSPEIKVEEEPIELPLDPEPQALTEETEEVVQAQGSPSRAPEADSVHTKRKRSSEPDSPVAGPSKLKRRSSNDDVHSINRIPENYYQASTDEHGNETFTQVQFTQEEWEQEQMDPSNLSYTCPPEGESSKNLMVAPIVERITIKIPARSRAATPLLRSAAPSPAVLPREVDISSRIPKLIKSKGRKKSAKASKAGHDSLRFVSKRSAKLQKPQTDKTTRYR
ncbi:hypothetical protein SISNIDRAFT_520464 [Sistotremastrum niveocremeum HHB9708]|uniref:Uncharacterized protein n=1 Tax=Sistotremastrum niveocremeum HHB9708 TaxID=1314777 RepID=A0A164R6A1_9AGAM|nr:hypothetical protein SISNIDRAFT_520464 [Sistotremastrum niveocremeum HHB9708]